MKRDADTLIAAVMAQHKLVHGRVAKRIRPEFVDDVVQDVFERAIDLIRQGRLVVEEEDNLTNAVRGWITLVLIRVCIHHLRRESSGWVRGEHVDLGALGTPDPTARLQAREEVRIATCRLSKEERAIMARVAAGNTIKEIAAELGIPWGTVASGLYRVRDVLRKRRARLR